MREILFRGKRTDNGEWIYGSLFRWLNFAYIGIKTDDSYALTSIEIIPETIGQFTGLTDKNGTNIFEGDILKIEKLSNGIDYYFPPLPYPVNVVVKWDFCAWMWETLCEDKRYLSFPDAWCHFRCEVIGNIHDNPEMLKGGEVE